MKPITKNKKNGFTLIELMVVIAILGVMATLVVVNFNRLRAQRSVILAENEMVTQIRKVQSYALSGRDTSINPLVTRPRYFGIIFEKDRNWYSIYELAESDQGYSFSELETVRMNEGAVIGPVNQTGATKLVCTNILFSVPYGKTYIYTSDDVCDDYISVIMQDPLQANDLLNKSVSVDVVNPKTTITKSINILGITGRVEGN